ncbi:hypothetical protein SLS58_005507 [Diplodia intermedia]|uniref:Nucleoside phosphorylase domain-containing protein n=1 Tax=Diplodia intermedia TaxID=856260 RepID=A0ABR3TR71_9PEZI
MTKLLLPKDQYTIGWVCALPVELGAAGLMLEEEHQAFGFENDTNTYTLGRVNGHNIVIACLPAGRTGTNSAATVVSQMKSSFPKVRFGLLVGIGGGVPSKDVDIRLGDVVVSQPGKGYGGVVQYDFGKTTPSGFIRTGYLSPPPTILLNVLSNVQAFKPRMANMFQQNLTKLVGDRGYTRDNLEPDILFAADYEHEKGPTCASCDKERQLERQGRDDALPLVHYGTIASGNAVIKYGCERDRVSAEFGAVLCFEMEAAGLMNDFPCLVIRGICDYADSHKSKSWQTYAAGTAAAYAATLLSFLPSTDVTREPAIYTAGPKHG